MVGDIVGAMLFDRRRLASLCVAFMFAAFTLAGCGGKSSAGNSSISSASATSKSASSSTDTGRRSGIDSSEKQFIALADPVCRKISTELARSSRVTVTPQAPGFAAGLIKNETIERRGNVGLAKLTPPLTLRPEWRKMLGYRRVLANQLGAYAAAIERKAKASEEALAGGKKQAHRQLREVAGKAGFTDCAKVG